MSPLGLLQYAAGIVFLVLAAGFGLLAGPYFHLIDDTRQPPYPQNRRNAILLAICSVAFAVFCFAMAAQ